MDVSSVWHVTYLAVPITLVWCVCVWLLNRPSNGSRKERNGSGWDFNHWRTVLRICAGLLPGVVFGLLLNAVPVTYFAGAMGFGLIGLGIRMWLRRQNAAAHSKRFKLWINVLVDGECRTLYQRYRWRFIVFQLLGAALIIGMAFAAAHHAPNLDPAGRLNWVHGLAAVMALAWLALTFASTLTLWREQSTSFPVRLAMFGVYIHTFLYATWMIAYPFISFGDFASDAYFRKLLVLFLVVAAAYGIAIVTPFVMWRVRFRAQREEQLHRFLATLRRIESALKRPSADEESYHKRSLRLAAGSLRDQFIEIIDRSTFRAYVALQPEQLPGDRKSAVDRTEDREKLFKAWRVAYVRGKLDPDLDESGEPLEVRARGVADVVRGLGIDAGPVPRGVGVIGRFNKSHSEAAQHEMSQWRHHVLKQLPHDTANGATQGPYLDFLHQVIMGKDPTLDPPTTGDPPRRWRDETDRALARALSPAVDVLADMAQAESLRTLARADYRYRLMYWIGRFLTTWEQEGWAAGLADEAKTETEMNLRRIDHGSTVIAVMTAVVSTLFGVGLTVVNAIVSSSAALHMLKGVFSFGAFPS